ncbi:DNA-binding GntR family transcriptional regulator [Bradyrhizobium sp. cir1]|uniref:hypothetical protein n=1 Tax=Bradyrhizobium sp. cir1 TaxID=1445730 RepID=UPI0017A5BD23|nr:DNA-binding GntR family transcriptional regulator [Bradyrhizobium sp. cir1]
MEGDKAQKLAEFDLGNRAFHHVPCAMSRLLATRVRNFSFDVRDGAEGRLTTHFNLDDRLILQALRARNIDQACQLLTRHIQSIERVALLAY